MTESKEKVGCPFCNPSGAHPYDSDWLAKFEELKRQNKKEKACAQCGGARFISDQTTYLVR